MDEERDRLTRLLEMAAERFRDAAEELKNTLQLRPIPTIPRGIFGGMDIFSETLISGEVEKSVLKVKAALELLEEVRRISPPEKAKGELEKGEPWRAASNLMDLVLSGKGEKEEVIEELEEVSKKLFDLAEELKKG